MVCVLDVCLQESGCANEYVPKIMTGAMFKKSFVKQGIEMDDLGSARPG